MISFHLRPSDRGCSSCTEHYRRPQDTSLISQERTELKSNSTLAFHQKHCTIHKILCNRSLRISTQDGLSEFFPGLHARLGSLTEFWSFWFLISSALQRSTSAFVHSQTTSSLNSSFCCEFSDFMRGNKIPRMHFMQLSLKNTLLYLPLEQ